MTSSALIYTRVSTEEQTRGYSLQTQLERCRLYATQKGYCVLLEVEDSHSGEALDRPGLNSLFDFAEKNPVDVVVIYDPDRLSRGGPAHHAFIEMRLEKSGVKVEYVLGDYNENSPESVLSKMIKQSIAWYENQQRRERIIRGRIGMAKAGRAVVGARPPYGYRMEDGRLLVDEEEAAVVRNVYTWLLEGQSTYQIAKRLCAAGIPTRGDKSGPIAKTNGYGIWQPSAVRKILNNSTYTGIWHYNKTKTTKVDGKQKQVKRPRSEWIAVQVPVIIERTVFERAQQRLSENLATSKRNTKRSYLLQGKLFCSCGLCCACSYRREVRYYRCQIKAGQTWRRACTTRFHMQAEKLEERVWSAVVDLLLDEDNLHRGIEEQRQRSQVDLDKLYTQLEAVVANKLDVERKLGILLDQLLDEEFPKAVVEERRSLLLVKLKRAESEQTKIQAELASMAMTPEQEHSLLAFAATIRHSIQDLDFEEKRKILDMLSIRVDVLSKSQVKVTGLLPFANDVVDVGSFVATTVGSYARLHTPLPARAWRAPAPSRPEIRPDTGAPRRRQSAVDSRSGRWAAGH